jgi:hypothetical protein
MKTRKKKKTRKKEKKREAFISLSKPKGKTHL